jgi:hypothetical protein
MVAREQRDLAAHRSQPAQERRDGR